MTVPTRTVEQRRADLEKAQAVRRERAELRAALKSGQRSGAALVRESEADARWHGVRVRWLLESLPGIGPARADAIMADCAIAATRRLGGLSERQRAALAAGLADGAR